MTIVLRGNDKATMAQARKLDPHVVVSQGWEIEGPTLFIGPGAAPRWDLLAHGFNFVERWDAAAPLWRYGVLAKDIGTADERRRTESLVRDLRIPVYAPELLFVRGSHLSGLLLEAWQEEQQHGRDTRLAFVRALYITKPVFCALPRDWLQEGGAVSAPARRNVGKAAEMVHVEIAPGRYVCCRPDEVEAYKARFERMRQKRRV